MNDDDSVARLRVPPHQVEAEQSVLGGLLLDNMAWDRVGDLLAEADFYRQEHRVIFGALAGIINASKPADVVTVFERLQAAGKADGAGGLPYLNQLAHCVASAANIRRYAEIVRERSILRRLIAASDEIATDAFNPQGRSVVDLLGQAEARIMTIGQAGARGAGAPYQQMQGLTEALLDRINDLAERGGSDIVGMSTGFDRLDQATGGLPGGDLIVLAARPGMGKSSLAMNIAEHAALAQGLAVGVFSMEMSAAQLTTRMVGRVGKIRHAALRSGRLQDEQWSRLSESVDRLGKAAIFIDESPGLRGSDIRSRARRMAKDAGGAGLGLIVIDYLQLMAGSGGDENRATELGEITRNLKAMGKELDCPVLLLSQLNRSVESRHDRRPMMSDLRDSGAIEQDADVVAFIYRDGYYNKDTKEPGVAEIILSKQRNGPACTIKLGWAGEITSFYNLAADYEPGQGAAQASDEPGWN